jgi:RNA polymerase sigma-70 factor (ECF subfamily)
MKNGFQVFTNELNSARSSGRFRGRTSIDESPVPDRIVGRAIARAKEGDREALRFLYLRYADNVYGYVRSIVRDDYDAEDVTQHVFAKLMTVIGKYEERDVAFSAWILRVARNVAVDHMRQRRPIPSDEVRDPDIHDEGESAQHRSLILRDALKTLPDEQREVLILRHLVGLSPGEIAGRLGRTEPSIHGLHHRGRGALRSALRDMECGPTVAHKIAA